MTRFKPCTIRLTPLSGTEPDSLFEGLDGSAAAIAIAADCFGGQA